MIKVKDTISFKTLREKGPAAIEVKGDEVIQVVSKGSEIKILISQDYFLQLVTAYNALMVRAGKIEDPIIQPGNLEERLGEIESKLKIIAKKANEI